MNPRTDLLDWDGGHGLRFTHDLFKFPGKFHPPLVEQILRSFTPTGVVDPMAGVGTVSVEAKAMGISSLSIDIDPVSVFFSKVKTTPISAGLLNKAWKDLSSWLGRIRRDKREIEVRKFHDIQARVMHESLTKIGAQDFERLTYWFRRYVLVDYARISYSIHNGGLPQRSEAVRRFFLACLLSSIRRISYADPSPVSGLEITKHMLQKIEDGYEIDVCGEFQRRAKTAMTQMDEYTSFLVDNDTYSTPVHVVRADCANLLSMRKPDDFRPDLVFFSPPYCNAIEYWRRHRLEYLLGGFLNEDDIVELKKKFIGRNILNGSRSSLQKVGYRPMDRLINDLNGEGKQRKAKILSQYLDDMRNRLRAFYKYLPRNGHCILVVGDSHTGGYQIPTTNTLVWLAESLGFVHLETRRYTIKNRVMQFPIKPHSKIERESIIVLQKVVDKR